MVHTPKRFSSSQKQRTQQHKKVALVYDRVNSFGGAERVLLALHSLFPDAPLYTSVYDEKKAPWATVFPKIYTSWIQLFPFFRSRHQLIGWLMPFAFESFLFDAYDLVISVTSEAAKGIKTNPHTKHISYILTPTRYLWSHAKEYEQRFYPGILRIFIPLHRLLCNVLRKWDVKAATRPDVLIPISTVVKKRIAQYYHRTAQKVIYPPVDVSFFQRKEKNQQQKSQNHVLFSNVPYYLVVSRLVAYKRIEDVIDACMQLQKHLVIIGKGPHEQFLRQRAHRSTLIHFVKDLTDDELVRYYQHSTAVIIPGEEDFGLIAVEAMAAGVPVITNRRSGNAELIIEGKTGYTFDSEKKDALLRAIRQCETAKWDRHMMMSQAMRCDISTFEKGWKQYE